jgi:hypothetical protein
MQVGLIQRSLSSHRGIDGYSSCGAYNKTESNCCAIELTKYAAKKLVNELYG